MSRKRNDRKSERRAEAVARNANYANLTYEERLGKLDDGAKRERRRLKLLQLAKSIFDDVREKGL